MTVEIVAGEQAAVLLAGDTFLGLVFRGPDAREQAEHFLVYVARGEAREALAAYPSLGWPTVPAGADGNALTDYPDRLRLILAALWEARYMTGDRRLSDEALQELAT